MSTQKSVSELKAKAINLKPVVRIGKAGLTEGIIKEVCRQLKRKRLIKIKFLRSFTKTNNKKDVARTLAKKTNSTIIQSTGFVVVLHKE